MCRLSRAAAVFRGALPPRPRAAMSRWILMARFPRLPPCPGIPADRISGRVLPPARSAWFTGSGTASGSGLTYFDGSSVSTIQGVNSRVLGFFNGDLYYSTGSGTVGIYKYGGLPAAAHDQHGVSHGIKQPGRQPLRLLLRAGWQLAVCGRRRHRCAEVHQEWLALDVGV